MSEAPLPQTKTIKLILDSNKSNKYDIEMKFNSESIFIIAKSINLIPLKFFEEKFSLSSIKQNKYFSPCETIDDVFLTIEPNINLKSPLLIEETSLLNLIISLNHPLIKDICFKLNETKKDANQSIIEVYSLINQLIKENQTLKEVNNKQDKEISDLKNRVEKLENENNNIIKEIENIKLKFNKKKDDYLQKNSKIIPNDKEKEKAIRNWINPNKELNINLIFRMSRDGSSPNDFHKLCDNKGPTLTLIETLEGYKFGGYTPINWDGSGVKFDNETFIFSLNKMKKYTKIKDTRTLNCNINYGPIFGDDDFYIQENMKKLNVHPYRTFLDKNELTDNNKNEFIEYSVKDFEVYTIK